tara:strand:- start:141 stop:296 length:156 start_codon:yes stop_codon:yes gene_type:complete
MGRGDKKSKKGKIFKGSYGVIRPRKSGSPINTTASTKKKKSSPKKKTTKKK